MVNSKQRSGPTFKIKMSFFQYGKSHRGGKIADKIAVLVVNHGISNTIVLEIPWFTTEPKWWSYLHNEISYTVKMVF